MPHLPPQRKRKYGFASVCIEEFIDRNCTFHVRIKVTCFNRNVCDSFCTLNSIWLNLRLVYGLKQVGVCVLGQANSQTGISSTVSPKENYMFQNQISTWPRLV